MREWGAVALATLLVGCVTVGESFRRHGLDRAAFEMQCPKDQLEMVALNRSLGSAAFTGSQVGVRGCGRQMVYVATEAGWIANSQSWNASNGPAVAPSAAPSATPPAPPP